MGQSSNGPTGADPRFRQLSPPQFGQMQPPQVQALANDANAMNRNPTMAQPPQGFRQDVYTPPPFQGQNPFPSGRDPYGDGDVYRPPFTGQANPFPNGRGPFGNPRGDNPFGNGR